MSKIIIEDSKVKRRIRKNWVIKIISFFMFLISPFLSIWAYLFFDIGTRWEESTGFAYFLILLGIVLFIYSIYGLRRPVKFENIKKDLIKKEEDKRIAAEQERKRIENEQKQLKINQDKTGFKLSNTYAYDDKFDLTTVVSTLRGDYKLKNQSCHLYTYEFDMPIFRLTTTNDLWGSITGVFDDKNKKYYLEFYFASKQWEMGHKFDSNKQPTCESSSLDIIVNSKKYSQKDVILMKNDKDISQIDKNTCIRVDQNFKFEVELKCLKEMASNEFEIRFSNFPNVFGKDNNWVFDENMKSEMKSLVNDFVNDMN